MNKLRVGNSITGFGTDYGGVFEGVCGASGGLVLPDGSLNSSCVIGYVLQTASGQLPQSMGNQSLTSAGAAWYGIAHVLLQVLGHCQFNDGSFYYPIWGRSVGLEPKDIESVQAIYNDPNMRIAMTFHASWEGEIDLLACCMREANWRDTYESEPGVFEPTDLDYLDYRYAAGAEKGVVVSTMGMVNAAPEFVAGPRATSSFNICEAENEDRPGEYLFSSRIRCVCSKQFPLIPWRTDFTGIADCSALP
jgi:hypothetical protein